MLIFRIGSGRFLPRVEHPGPAGAMGGGETYSDGPEDEADDNTSIAHSAYSQQVEAVASDGQECSAMKPVRVAERAVA